MVQPNITTATGNLPEIPVAFVNRHMNELFSGDDDATPTVSKSQIYTSLTGRFSYPVKKDSWKPGAKRREI